MQRSVVWMAVALGNAPLGCATPLAVEVPDVGAPAHVSIDAVPGERFSLRVPLTNRGTSAATARIRIANPGPTLDVSAAEWVQIPSKSAADLIIDVELADYEDVTFTVHAEVRDEVSTTHIEVRAERDADDDGFESVDAGGDDCEDRDPLVNPDAVDDTCDGVDDNCDGTPDEAAPAANVWPDADGDGYGSGTPEGRCDLPDGAAALDGDCDDGDPARHPGAVEQWYDGVDQDCDGRDDDRDGDGWLLAEDCDDDAPAVFPGAEEVDNGVDDDCDGFLDEAVIGFGDLVFTELFSASTTSVGAGEWVELTNPTASHVELMNPALIVDGATTALTARIIAPNQVWVLCAEADPLRNGGVACDDVAQLPVGFRTLALSDGDTTLDDVDTVAWPWVAGRAFELGASTIDATLNDAPTAWCTSVSTFGDRAGDRGTPGLLLPPC